MSIITLNKINKELNEHKDARIKELIQGDINDLLLSNLLAPHIRSINFDIRYISSGLSGAGVILVVTDNGLPIIIKYGSKELIDRERDNYNKKVKDSLSPHVSVSLKETYTVVNNYASIAYTWAGGWNEIKTFRDYYNREESCENICRQIDFLLEDLFKWYKIKKGTDLPYKQWDWSKPSHIIDLVYKISMLGKDQNVKERLIEALKNPIKWIDHLRLKQCSLGICHGDLNCRNILIVYSNLGVFPKIIDFASIRENTSPAKDWAKVERDIKFRFLRDAIPDNISFYKTIEEVDTVCNLSNKDITPHIEKPCSTISYIRKKYSDKTQNISDIPYLEYLLYLFYTTLAYVIHDEIKEDIEIQKSVINSAYQTLVQIDHIIFTNSGSIYPGIFMNGNFSLNDQAQPESLKIKDGTNHFASSGININNSEIEQLNIVKGPNNLIIGKISNITNNYKSTKHKKG